MKYYCSLILILLLTLLPAQAIADDTVEKTFCTQATGYENLDELKANLLLNAQRLAVNELFGELIAASTAIENFVVTSDQIRASSLGLVRLDGLIDYYNGKNLAEVCVTIHAYTTEQDREKFKPVKLTKRHCVTDADMTTRELTNFAKEEVIVQALLDYDRRLEQEDRTVLLRLLQKVNYVESGFIPDTETYCTRAEGYITPIEIIALTERDASIAGVGEIDYKIKPASPQTQKDETRHEQVILSTHKDNTYVWREGAPTIFTETAFDDEVAFMPTGNNHFIKELGIIGYEKSEIRFVNFNLFLLKPNAGLLFQAYIDGSWKYRWGYDGRPLYNGINWPRRGQTVNIAVGKWSTVEIDLLNDLGAKPGQRLLGLAFSSNDGNLIYDRVSLLSSASIASPTLPAKKHNSAPTDGETIILSDNEDTYAWISGKPYRTTEIVYEGDVAFIPTGNNHFFKDFGTIGHGEDEIQYIMFAVYLTKKETGLLFQAYINNSWEHRWGIDGRSAYSGAYTWNRLGQSVNLPVGEWITVKLDLVKDLGAKPGQKLLGLGFSGGDGNLVYDRVSILGSK